MTGSDWWSRANTMEWGGGHEAVLLLFTITIITISYGEKHGPVKVRRAHLISDLLFVKGKKNTPKQPVVLWVNRRKNPQDVISDPRYVGMSVPCCSPFRHISSGIAMW